MKKDKNLEKNIAQYTLLAFLSFISIITFVIMIINQQKLNEIDTNFNFYQNELTQGLGSYDLLLYRTLVNISRNISAIQSNLTYINVFMEDLSNQNSNFNLSALQLAVSNSMKNSQHQIAKVFKLIHSLTRYSQYLYAGPLMIDRWQIARGFNYGDNTMILQETSYFQLLFASQWTQYLLANKTYNCEIEMIFSNNNIVTQDFELAFQVIFNSSYSLSNITFLNTQYFPPAGLSRVNIPFKAPNFAVQNFTIQYSLVVNNVFANSDLSYLKSTCKLAWTGI